MKSVDVTLSRSQAQTLIALLTDALGEPLFATLREARAGALAAFTASAGRHLRGA